MARKPTAASPTAASPTAARPTAGKRTPKPIARARYRFDNTLANGPLAAIAYLAALTVGAILVAATMAVLFKVAFGDGSDGRFVEDLWQTVLRTLDPGTFANDETWPGRIFALVITLTGIFIAGSLIGLIATAVDQRIERIREGRSQVLEAGHTLILGWSDQAVGVVSELVAANASERDACIVVLSDEAQQVVERTLRGAIKGFGPTRIVARTGDRADPADLAMCALSEAKSVIVLRGPSGDAGVVRSILAAHAVEDSLDRRRMVAELEDEEYEGILSEVSKDRLVTVSRRTIAQLTAQACLHAGMGSVLKDLIDFGGDEIYLSPVGPLAGKPMAEAMLAFERACVIGCAPAVGPVELNPPGDRILSEGDQVVVIAEDDSTIAYSPAPFSVPPHAQLEADPTPPQHLVVIGWSSFAACVLREIDGFLAPGSTIDVHVDGDLVDPSTIDTSSIRNAQVTTSGEAHLLTDVRTLDLACVEQVLVFAYRDQLAPEDADARTLLTLLLLRSLWPEGRADARLVAELVDQGNLRVATPIKADDLIVSDALCALVVAQLSERTELKGIFERLFEPTGPVMRMRHARWLVPDAELAFGQVIAAGVERGVSVIGYRIARDDRTVLNPAKNDRVRLADDDEVILIEGNDVGPPVP